MLRRIIQTGLVAAAVAAVASVAYGAVPSANGTISACVDSKGALKLIDAEAGATCGAGKQALTWNKQGPAGKDGVSGRVVVSLTTASDSVDYKALQVNCPSGKVPVGGGGQTAGFFGFPPDAVAIQTSIPSADGLGWYVVANETLSTGDTWSLGARVVCVTAS